MTILYSFYPGVDELTGTDESAMDDWSAEVTDSIDYHVIDPSGGEARYMPPVINRLKDRI